MTRHALRPEQEPAMEPVDEAVDHVRGSVRGTPTLFIDSVVHRGAYDPATLLEALAPERADNAPDLP
jgi:hypothetical protein